MKLALHKLYKYMIESILKLVIGKYKEIMPGYPAALVNRALAQV